MTSAALAPAPARARADSAPNETARAPLAALLGARVGALVVALLAFAASFTSAGNGFAYDDTWIIVQNPNVHSLSKVWHVFAVGYWSSAFGNRLYRPVTLLAYALQWTAGGGSPAVFHAVNIALYMALAVAVYALLRRVAGPAAAIAAGALFAVHPVHVEAVGNAVGQSEISVALVVVGVVAAYLRWREAGRLRPAHWATLLVAYAAGCLMKENAIVLPALLVAAELCLVRDERPRRARIADTRLLVLAMVAAAGATLLLRVAVLGELGGDDPHPAMRGMPAGPRARVMLALVPTVAKLLVWPTRLLADYSPSDTPLHTTFGAAHLPGIALVLAVLALGAACWRRCPAVTFGVAWLVVTVAPTSNIFFPTGVLIAERALLLPSVGVLIAVAALASWVHRTAPGRRSHALSAAAATLCAVLVAVGAWRSAQRQHVWKDNMTLFEQTVRDAPLNGRAHYSYGYMLYQKGDLVAGEREWRTAMDLDPEFIDIPIELAKRLLHDKRPADAKAVLAVTIRRFPMDPLPRLLSISCDLRMSQFAEAIREADEGERASGSPLAFDTLRNTARAGLARTLAAAGGTR